MVSRRTMSVLVIVALIAGSRANAQVRPLGAVNHPSRVQQACCECGVDYGYAGCAGQCGTVWGTTCLDPCCGHPGLYPPCPNPCRTTLVGELLLDIRHVVCSSLTHVFSCAFGTCGMVTCARCGPCVTDCYDCCDSYDCGSCDCGGAVTTSDCGCYGGSVHMSPLEVGQPAPAAVDEQGNPFRDDPAQGTGAMGAQQTMRTRSILPAPRAAAQTQPVRRSVRRASYQEPVSRSAQLPASPSVNRNGARTISNAVPSRAGHYIPQRTSTLRPTRGVQLQPVPQASGSASALRFRDAD